ncbi:MAG: DUF362 domain-containing protein [Candidatus Brocadiia bacterium]
MAERSERDVDRRDFLRTSAAATAAAMAAPRLAAAADGPTVAIVKDKTGNAVRGLEVDAEIAQKLVDQAVMTLAGKDDIVAAWRTFVDPKEKVAVKFNGLFRNATSHPEVVDAVTKRLVEAGVDPANIVVYDRDEKAFRTANIAMNRDGDGPRAIPTGKDYGPDVKAGPVGTKISNILHRADALVNLSVLKTHQLAGISAALKNHLGTVPNAWNLHKGDEKNPKSCLYVADLNALDPIRKKTRICICEGLYALYHGGPRYSPPHRWDYGGVLAATDPVALDTTAAEIIKAKRREKGMSEYHKPIVHVTRAAELGLGCGDPEKIKRVEREV